MRIFGWSIQDRILYDGIPTTVRFFPGNAALMDTLWAYFASIHDVFNDYNDASEVGRLNAAPQTGAVSVSPAMAHTLAFCLEAGARVPGFDITLRPLRNLWKAAAVRGQYPTPTELEEVRQRTGQQHLAVDGPTLIRKVPGMELDFGGVIKGLAVDRAIQILQDAGVTAAFVQMGAETAAFGLSPRGKRHVLTFHTALEGQPTLGCLADPGDGLSGSSSANNARPIKVGNQDLYHILDPRTGAPISSQLVQVSVYFPRVGQNGLAEVLTKACAIAGFERMAPVLKAVGAEALFLNRDDGGVYAHSTPGWRQLVATVDHTA